VPPLSPRPRLHTAISPLPPNLPGRHPSSPFPVSLRVAYPTHLVSHPTHPAPSFHFTRPVPPSPPVLSTRAVSPGPLLFGKFSLTRLFQPVRPFRPAPLYLAHSSSPGPLHSPPGPGLFHPAHCTLFFGPVPPSPLCGVCAVHAIPSQPVSFQVPSHFSLPCFLSLSSFHPTRLSRTVRSTLSGPFPQPRSTWPGPSGQSAIMPLHQLLHSCSTRHAAFHHVQPPQDAASTHAVRAQHSLGFIRWCVYTVVCMFKGVGNGFNNGVLSLRPCHLGIN
jgi:hypothetical protein